MWSYNKLDFYQLTFESWGERQSVWYALGHVAQEMTFFPP